MVTFFGTNNVSELESELTGSIFDKTQLEIKLHNSNLSQYFQGIPEQEIIDLLAG